MLFSPNFQVYPNLKELVIGNNVRVFVLAIYVEPGMIILAVIVAFSVLCTLASLIIKELNRRL